jgi:hypothetical protein
VGKKRKRRGGRGNGNRHTGRQRKTYRQTNQQFFTLDGTEGKKDPLNIGCTKLSPFKGSFGDNTGPKHSRKCLGQL